VGKVVTITLLRWIAVVPAGLLGWYIGFLTGVALLSAAINLCPAESMVSGACIAPWFRYAEALIFCVSVALAAFLVVALPALVAPRWRLGVAWAAFGVGLIVAVYLVVYTATLLEFVSAVIAGLLGVVGVVKLERMRGSWEPGSDHN
jgi:hypothetical protein